MKQVIRSGVGAGGNTIMEKKKPKVDTYEDLLAALRKLFAEAKAKGLPLFERYDLLKCKACGAYEDVLPISKNSDGKRKVFLNPKYEVDREFTVIDTKERKVRAPKGRVRYQTTYQVICGVCGVHQRCGFTSEFDEI